MVILGGGRVGRATAGGMQVVPDPSATLPPDAEIVLIGTDESEQKFLELYGSDAEAQGWRLPPGGARPSAGAPHTA